MTMDRIGTDSLTLIFDSVEPRDLDALACANKHISKEKHSYVKRCNVNSLLKIANANRIRKRIDMQVADRLTHFWYKKQVGQCKRCEKWYLKSPQGHARLCENCSSGKWPTVETFQQKWKSKRRYCKICGVDFNIDTERAVFKAKYDRDAPETIYKCASCH